MAGRAPGYLPRSNVDENEIHLEEQVVELAEQDPDDEVIEGQPLGEVAVVKVEEEEGEDEDEVLPGELSEGTAEELHPSHSQDQSCPTGYHER